VWHAKTESLQRAGKIRMVGIIEEQHPDRARLFMQWKQMDWPILVDSLNLFQMTAVPVTVLIDERGIVRKIGPNEADVDAFLEEGRSESDPSAAVVPPDLEQLRIAAESGGVDEWRRFASAVVLWGQGTDLERGIEAFQRAVALSPEDGETHFRLGVAYRKRYDSAHRVDGDFAAAVRHWGRALAIDPNQYIWRRRIQQYGPRLDKPYSFYDWVNTARSEIRERGEVPSVLLVEPGGAEFAAPSREFAAVSRRAVDPDPEGRIQRDVEGFVSVETTVVPSQARPGQPVRIHLVFRPNPAIKAHWNNEAADLALWVDPPEGWRVDGPLHTVANPPEAVDRMPRRIEFELQCAPNATAGEITIRCHALYYACEDATGVCVYRRQEIPVRVPVSAEAPRGNP
jgi:hypothetical protein